jgi:hypothetical protein
MSDDGSYVFFDSTEALVPQATNHTLDTYEWHEDPVSHERSLSLIGSGSDPAATYFLGYSPLYTGNGEKVEAGSVFIGTHAKLVPQDTNSVGDIYAARVCGVQTPCIQPPAGETAQCEGGSCQTAMAEPPVTTPGTLTAGASGNVPPLAVAPPPKKAAAQISAEQLAKALKLCRKMRSKKRRVGCEAQARKKYGAIREKADKKSGKTSRGGRR